MKTVIKLSIDLCAAILLFGLICEAAIAEGEYAFLAAEVQLRFTPDEDTEIKVVIRGAQSASWQKMKISYGDKDVLIEGRGVLRDHSRCDALGARIYIYRRSDTDIDKFRLTFPTKEGAEMVVLMVEDGVLTSSQVERIVGGVDTDDESKGTLEATESK